MAQIYGQPGNEPGDKVVYEALKHLPNECIVFAQPKLKYRTELRDPDYVIIYPKRGLVVLEVKDWIQIVDRDRRNAWLRSSRSQSGDQKTSPVEQARQAAHILENMLMEDRNLRDYAGRRDFAYAYAGVLPFLPAGKIQWLEEEWGEGYLLGKEDLEPTRIAEAIDTIPSSLRLMMTDRQIDAACAIIDPRLKRIDRTNGKLKGVLDRNQQSIAKEALARPTTKAASAQSGQVQLGLNLIPPINARTKNLEAEMPEDVASLKSSTYVRLVRGFAGTGKTDVLVLRAHYLHEQYPELDILVTTFNDPVYQNRLLPELQGLQPKVNVIKFDTLCSCIYRKRYGRGPSPQDTAGLITARLADHPLVQELGPSFVADEFIWMKEMGRVTREEYVSRIREGRGGTEGRTFGRKVKREIFDLFEIYQAELRKLGCPDWVDFHEETWCYLQQGGRPDKLYDVVLIDEAQHFAPIWMRIVSKLLKPGGTLFICDDPSQSVYRHYSWLQKGVEVRGRTRWLRTPYRNTRQIFEAAYALIANDPLAQKLLAEEGDSVQPNLDDTVMRDGPRPEAHFFPTWQAELEFTEDRIKTLVQQEGVLPNEIGILHEEKYVLDRYRSLVPKGVQIYEVKRQTGLEYKVVFVPQIQKMSERTVGLSWEEDQSRQRLKFYMTMTRARQQVFMLCQQNWPKLLEPVRPYVEWVAH